MKPKWKPSDDGAHAEQVGRHPRPAAEQREEGARGERRGQRVAPEAVRAHQLGIGAELRGEARRAARGWSRRGRAPISAVTASAEDQHEHEDRLPAEGLVEPAADHRADHRHQRHAHGDVADHARRLVGRHHVADDGAAERDARGDRRLRHAEGEEDLDRRRAAGSRRWRRGTARSRRAAPAAGRSGPTAARAGAAASRSARGRPRPPAPPRRSRRRSRRRGSAATAGSR